MLTKAQCKYLSPCQTWCLSRGQIAELPSKWHRRHSDAVVFHTCFGNVGGTELAGELQIVFTAAQPTGSPGGPTKQVGIFHSPFSGAKVLPLDHQGFQSILAIFSPQVTPKNPFLLTVQSCSVEPILSQSHRAVWRRSRSNSKSTSNRTDLPRDLELLVAVRSFLEVAYCCCPRNIAPHLSDQERCSPAWLAEWVLQLRHRLNPGLSCLRLLSFPCLHYRTTSNKYYPTPLAKTTGVKA